MASAARESDHLRKAGAGVTEERDGLVQKSRDFERVLAEKGSLETRLAMAAEVAMAQEEAIAGLEKKLEEAYAVQDATSRALEAVKARAAKRVD